MLSGRAWRLLFLIRKGSSRKSGASVLTLCRQLATGPAGPHPFRALFTP